MAASIGMSLVGPGWAQLRGILQRMSPIDTRRALRAGGQFLLIRVRKGILSGKPGGVRFTPNAPATVRKKGFNKPWVDTGQTAAEVDLKETRSGGFAAVFVGIERSRVHIKDPRRRVARIARFHEFGTATEPARSVFGAILSQDDIRLRELFGNVLGADLGIIGPVRV